MRTRYVLLLCCLLMAAFPSTGLGQDALHTFTTPDGRTLNAVIKVYNSRTGKIQIEREDGKELWTLPSVFSKPDQEYIQQWITVDQFMSPSYFKIKGDSDIDSISKRSTKIEYEITLDNQTDFPLKDLKIEYRAFIQNQGYNGGRDSSRVDGGDLSITELPVGKKVSKQIRSLMLSTVYVTISEYDSVSQTTSTYPQKTQEEHLEGFWVKVYGPSIDGNRAVREWCYPKDTRDDYDWQNKTTRVSNPTTTSQPGSRKTNDYGIGSSSLTKSDPAKALKLMQEKFEKDPSSDLAKNIGYTYIWYLKPRNIPLGLEWLEKAAARDNRSACTLLSGMYSTYYGHNNYLDVEKAVKYGQQSLSIKLYDLPHQTMALAYALDGQFENAVEHQKQAMELYKELRRKSNLIPSQEQLYKMEAKLKLYQSNNVK